MNPWKAQSRINQKEQEALEELRKFLKEQRLLARERRSQQVSEEKEVEVQTYTEPALGWRAWLVSGNLSPGLLSLNRGSTNNRTEWPCRHPLSALCLKGVTGCAESPGERCLCGIYAVSTIFEVWKWADWNHRRDPTWSKNKIAVGLVSLWGDVVEYDRGYRAQYAYPARLWLPKFPFANPDGYEEKAELLADMYEVECDVIEPSWKEIPGYDTIYARTHLEVPEIKMPVLERA